MSLILITDPMPVTETAWANASSDTRSTFESERVDDLNENPIAITASQEIPKAIKNPSTSNKVLGLDSSVLEDLELGTTRPSVRPDESGTSNA